MTQIDRTILEDRLQRQNYRREVANLRESEGNLAADLMGDFSHAYRGGKYPNDFDTEGIILEAKFWKEAEFPKGTLIPETNPVWEHTVMNHGTYFLMLMEVTHENGFQIRTGRDRMVYYDPDELLTLNRSWNAHFPDHKNNDVEIFVPGERVGFVKFPQSWGSDLWMFHNPSQDSLDEMHEFYAFAEELYV